MFLQFGSFAAAVTDFYTYVGSVLARPDLDDDEWLGFKGLLLDYLETIVDAVARHTGTIRVALDALDPSLPTIIARLADADPDLERLRAAARAAKASNAHVDGRSTTGSSCAPGSATDAIKTSGAAQLRAAAARAVGALLANVKRMNAASSREASLRKHFLRLAGWFDTATPTGAHVLFTSALALYGARHLASPRSRRRRSAAGDHQLVASPGCPSAGEHS